MNELIKISEKDGKQLVSAKELYLGLGLEKSNWSRWSKVNIEEDKFFNENEDWVRLKDDSDNQLVTNPNKVSYDYAICLEFAKHIAMMARTEKSYDYRNYFLECERLAKQQLEKALPKTFAEALRLAAEQAEELERQQKLIAEQKPKAEYFDALVDRKLNINFRDTAKEIGVKEKDFINFLLDRQYLYRDKKGQLKPIASYVDKGLFEIKEWTNENKSGNQTLITPKGRETFRLLLKGC